MPKEDIFIVHWYGPYEGEEAARIEDAGVLYLATGGTCADKRRKFRYCGITGSRFRDRRRQHHRLDEITIDQQLWMGWLHYPHRYRPRREHLEAVESLIVYYWGELLNKRKATSAPRGSLTLVSRWFSRNDPNPGRKPRYFAKLPDVISWDAEREVWKTADFRAEYRDY